MGSEMCIRDSFRTDGQDVLVENLKVGDLVLTADRGLQPISWIGGRKLSSEDLRSSPNLYPVRIRAKSLGNGLPERDLIVSRQHRILLRSKIAERMFGTREVLVAAIKLIDVPGIDVMTDVETVDYFHLLFDRHEIVISNGTPTESLFTGQEALAAVSPQSRLEIETIFPHICTPEFSPTAARPIPQRGRAIQKFVTRHLKNDQELVDVA